MVKAIDTTDIKPPAKQKRKRATRSDKGKPRGTKSSAKTVQSKATKTVSKYLFDEVVINGQWWVQVKDNLCSRSTDDGYVVELMLNGTRFTYVRYFADPTLAYAVGEQLLQYRYQNRNLYQ